MRVPTVLYQGLGLLLACQSALAASTAWTFTDATLTVQGKGSGVGSGLKEKLQPSKPLSSPVSLGAGDSLKIILTAQEGKSAKRPHQASLLLQNPATNLDVSYPFSVKESGKGKIELSHKDLPTQFLRSSSPLSASVVIASFGSSEAYKSEAFPLIIQLDANTPAATTEKPLRYGKQPEIHHIFRSDPKSPNIVLVAFFTIAAVATLPVLLGLWLQVGGNVAHLSKALSDAPVSHGLFFGSVVAIEGIFFLYYTVWNLFQTLPVLAVVGVVAYISGSRALTEVQERRLAGLR
ncbi:uncharacterized protein HMPREF1541_06884 [Cyphellophora europaea CBS 101466]|uniref:Ribophorin II C-terminal domain-containing protein n=1 Tax=Cyphellophora europaea (strain CBS 101466) TaxID=1220924 RepID=W2RSX6_CYPE1|nr:uncharacterized protein HMPREF1541_06884 [Cyphellophora europaea CBS 101466]ETN38843.1 hypothetical protein HMPREF1541_06884 [Cyphellophora europaea CBS 101466]